LGGCEAEILQPKGARKEKTEKNVPSTGRHEGEKKRRVTFYNRGWWKKKAGAGRAYTSQQNGGTEKAPSWKEAQALRKEEELPLSRARKPIEKTVVQGSGKDSNNTEKKTKIST